MVMSGSAELNVPDADKFVNDVHAQQGVRNAFANEVGVTRENINVTLVVVRARRLAGRRMASTAVKAHYVIKKVLGGDTTAARTVASRLLDSLAEIDSVRFASNIVEAINAVAKANGKAPMEYNLIVKSIHLPQVVALKSSDIVAPAMIPAGEIQARTNPVTTTSVQTSKEQLSRTTETADPSSLSSASLARDIAVGLLTLAAPTLIVM